VVRLLFTVRFSLLGNSKSHEVGVRNTALVSFYNIRVVSVLMYLNHVIIHLN
jgi:hypothetical protein